MPSVSKNVNEVDWTGTEDMDITQLISHAKEFHDTRFKQFHCKWASQVLTESVSSISRVGCRKCECNGLPHEWKDHWSPDKMEDGTIVRHHTRPRTSLFTPCKVKGLPGALSAIGGTRVTIGTYADGSPFTIMDDWKSSMDSHRQLQGE